VITAIALGDTLPDRLELGPKWAVAAIELLLLVPLTLTSPHRHHTESRRVRAASVALIAVINLANFISLGFLVHLLLAGRTSDGRGLITAAVEIWITNVIVFGLWYWELDRGGPGARTHPEPRTPDFLFPQMSTPDLAGPAWRPHFMDYLYLSLTNATAFSPTDTMPLTPQVKALMAAQSLVSLITVALVAARAVNILS